MEASDLASAIEVDTLCLPRPWSEAIWREELESPFALYLVLEEEGEILAQIGVRYLADELHVTTLAVRPEHRPRPFPLRGSRLRHDGPPPPLLRQRGRAAHDPPPRGSPLEPRRLSRSLRASSRRCLRASGGSKGFRSRSAGTRQARKETKMPPAIRGSTGPRTT